MAITSDTRSIDISLPPVEKEMKAQLHIVAQDINIAYQ